MRQIKFRAYDTWTKQMIMPVGISIMSTIWEEWDLTINPADTRFVLMLYTGRKDKKLKEIYEDDIVKVGNEIILIEWCQRHYNRVYEPIGFHFPYCGDDEIEIIGNIFENRDLLNDNK